MVHTSIRLLKLGHTLSSITSSLSNGPGWRINLWTQGCSLRCTESCLNPEFLVPSRGYKYPVNEVVDAIFQTAINSHRDVEGITILGGEPTDQLESMVLIMEAVQVKGLSTMVYTGHTYESLAIQSDPLMKRFLELTDILVDGPFESGGYHDKLMWRGSANQRILCLSSRYTSEGLREAFAKQGKGFSLLIDSSGNISISGMQTLR